jgi:GWxTD domain-containing protein
MVIGHFRPVILMPAGLLAGLPAGQIEAILLHELAHIRRYDYIVNVLQRSVEGLLFYHPAMWWISRVIRAEREHCCDDVVVATIGNAHEYAVALAALEQNRWSGREPAVAATGGSLVKRIRRLLDPKGPNGAWSPVIAAGILMATAAAALAAWQAAPTPYDRWLNEDVVYIAGDEERAAFQKLTTDHEREKFIERFWLRRDPAPGTSKNEVKEEHYRRIANALQRFRTLSGRPGWQTDRGHMYIVYGPPDELESHPKGARRSSATEVWMYWHVEGIGDRLTLTFVDRTGTGDYRLAPGKAR